MMVGLRVGRSGLGGKEIFDGTGWLMGIKKRAIDRSVLFFVFGLLLGLGKMMRCFT